MLGFMNLTEYIAGRDPLTEISALSISYIQTILIAVVILSIFQLIDVATHGPAQAEPIRPTQRQESSIVFFDRISDSLGRDLLCLKMEDHYLRVKTKIGSELIHLRLSDAIEELHELPGFQPHRSWWVHKDAISSVQKTRQRYELILIDGSTIPIARRRIAELKQQGWLTK